jgi:hypothetical protein
VHGRKQLGKPKLHFMEVERRLDLDLWCEPAKATIAPVAFRKGKPVVLLRRHIPVRIGVIL